MKKEIICTVLFLALAGAFGILPRSREPEELTLLTELAADRREGDVVLTALVGARIAEEREPEFLTGRGPDLSAAVADLVDLPLRQPYLGQTEALLIGDGLTGETEEVVRFVLDYPQMKTDMALYLVEGEAKPLLEAWAEETHGETRPEDPCAVTVGEVLADLSRRQASPVPTLMFDHEGNVVRGEERYVRAGI